METPVHLIVSIALAVIIYPIYGPNAVFIIVGGVLIDIDHYLWYIAKFRKYSPKKCYHYCAKGTINDNWKHVTGSFFIFHNIEFFVAAIILSIYFDWALMFTIGLLSHYILDLIWHLYKIKKPTHALSFVRWLIRRKPQIQKF